MRRRSTIGAAVLALILLFLAGCHQTTTVRREEQLALVTTGCETDAPASTALTATVTVTVTVTEDASTTAPEGTAFQTGETTPPVTTRAAKPTASEPATSRPTEKPAPSTAPSETTADTAAPETTVPETSAGTLSPETTTAAEEADPYDISGHTVGSLEYEILSAINAERSAAGLPELTLSSRLCAIASVRAYEASVTFTHTRPDGGAFSTVLSDYGFGYSTAAENLLQCRGSYSAQDMVDLWMSSEDHAANILDPDFTTAGIGVYRSGSKVYVANLFVG